LMSGFELVSEYWFLMVFETWFESGLVFELVSEYWFLMVFETWFGSGLVF